MSGAEALDIIRNSPKPPDFVILDWMMPNMSGLEVCEELRRQFPVMCEFPIVMVSAKSRPEHILEGLSKGANDYITKPVDRLELMARIRTHLRLCEICKKFNRHGRLPVDAYKPFICDSCQSSGASPIVARRNSSAPVTSTMLKSPIVKSKTKPLSASAPSTWAPTLLVHDELLHEPSNYLEIFNASPAVVTIYHNEEVLLRNQASKKVCFFFFLACQLSD